MDSQPSASSPATAEAASRAHARASASTTAHAIPSSSSSLAPPSTSRFGSQSNPFRRSSSSSIGASVLARFTRSASQRTQPPADIPNDAHEPHSRPSIGRRISSRASRKSLSADPTSGANLAELSKPTGKFRSGVNWGPQQAPEPFMDSFTDADRKLAESLQAEAALASGSTAAAQSHAQARGLGQPIFVERPSISSAATTNTASASTADSPSPPTSISQLPTVSQTIAALTASGINPDVLATATPPKSSSPPSQPHPEQPAPAERTSMHVSDDTIALAHPDGATIADGDTPCTTPPPKSRQPSHGENGSASTDNHMLARAAQLVLEAARQQARVETRKKGRSAPASPKRMSSSLSPIPTVSPDANASQEAVAPAQASLTEPSQTPSQRDRSKSDAAGQGAGVQRRKSFLRSMSARSRRERKEASEGSETPTPTSNSPIIASTTTSGTTTPGGRQRRYVDTRDLDLLARELAAEAIAEQLQQQQFQPPFARPSRSGSSSPLRSKAAAFNDPRRRSFPSILEDSPLQDDSIIPVGAASGALKPMTPLSPSSRSNPRSRASDAKSKVGVGSPSTVSGLPADPTNGLVPQEMFLGLGGSPYPSLPPGATRAGVSSLDNLDPFGIPLTQESSPFDATTAYANKTSVYHTPNQVAVSRSLSGASTWSAAQTSPNAKRRPVLTMTMNDPQAELQGLTKPPKENGKRLTPFGSRAGSRAPSPSPSFTNLKKEAAAQDSSADSAAGDAVNGSSEVADAADASSLAGKPTSAVQSENNSIHVPSRRNSLAVSDKGSRSSLAPAKQKKAGRLSTMFRSGRSKEQSDAASSAKGSSAHAVAASASSAEASAYATPTGETSTLALSPVSAAVSADSDADISPVAFRAVELPATQDAARRSAPASASASRRSSMALEAADRPAPKKRPIRALLRRLSSFSKSDAKEAAKDNSAKANFPDASTMPIVDMDKLKQLSQNPDAKTTELAVQEPASESSKEAAHSASEAASADGVEPVTDKDTTDTSGLAPRIQGLDLSNASPVPVNQEMAKSGFGTRSAYKFGDNTSTDSDVRKPGSVKVIASPGDGNQDSTASLGDASRAPDKATDKATDKANDKEDSWERPGAALIQRADSQTPCSEDSFFLGSGQSTNSRPGSGALMKHGSESAMSEELYTPDPSTAYLPATKADGAADPVRHTGMLEEATLSSTVSSATAAADAKATVAEPVVTAVPHDEAPRLTAA
ncbi:uncharacterized protein PSANT_05079 [Moesziomyces antarcticus]|uniref:Uncharacterized protein n=1 Tax=Pseudozyma antarctica TaxID=84753 RepID=A0A5C3FUX5_PSEA2|nr:uncharacterized protein PSANT_05079 [Moesziomyces antarcticus]